VGCVLLTGCKKKADAISLFAIKGGQMNRDLRTAEKGNRPIITTGLTKMPVRQNQPLIIVDKLFGEKVGVGKRGKGNAQIG